MIFEVECDETNETNSQTRRSNGCSFYIYRLFAARECVFYLNQIISSLYNVNPSPGYILSSYFLFIHVHDLHDSGVGATLYL